MKPFKTCSFWKINSVFKKSDWPVLKWRWHHLVLPRNDVTVTRNRPASRLHLPQSVFLLVQPDSQSEHAPSLQPTFLHFRPHSHLPILDMHLLRLRQDHRGSFDTSSATNQNNPVWVTAAAFPLQEPSPGTFKDFWCPIPPNNLFSLCVTQLHLHCVKSREMIDKVPLFGALFRSAMMQ